MKFGTLGSSEKTIDFPQETDGGHKRQNREWIRQANRFDLTHGKTYKERRNGRGISVRSRNGAPSRKGCVVNGQMTKASNKYAPLLPSCPRYSRPYARKYAQCAEVRLTSGSCWDEPRPTCDSPNAPRHFALGARDVRPVGDTPTCSVPSLWGYEGLPMFIRLRQCTK